MIEILVTLGIFVILAGIGFPTISNYFRQSNGEQARSIVIDAFREAQTRAMASDGNQPWSIHITPTTMYVFPGTTFNLGTATAYALPNNAQVNATFVDTTFSKNRGFTSVQGTVTLSTNSISQSFTLYASGILSPQ